MAYCPQCASILGLFDVCRCVWNGWNPTNLKWYTFITKEESKVGEMTDEQALLKLKDKEWWEVQAIYVAIKALEEKVAAKKPKRPTLEEMERTARLYARDDEMLMFIADVLKAVREDTVKALLNVSSEPLPCNWDLADYASWAKNRLRALGEVVP